MVAQCEPGARHGPAKNHFVKNGNLRMYSILLILDIQIKRIGVANSISIMYSVTPQHFQQGDIMRSVLLWLLGVPIPIIILIALFWH